MIEVINREILIPREEYNIGTCYDDNAETRHFHLKRVTSSGIDLAALTFNLDIQYADGNTDAASLVKEVTDKDINLVLTINNSMLQVPGTVLIQIRALNEDGVCKWTSYKSAFFVEDHINTPGHYEGDLTQLEQYEAEWGKVRDNVNQLNSRMDEVVKIHEETPATEVEEEVIDGRVGYNGTQYDSFGTAVRQQIIDVREDMEENTDDWTEALAAETTARTAADNTLQGNINSEASTRATNDANLQSQINQIIAPSGEAPSAAEVENARIGADNVTYSTLGEAIRGQVTDLKSTINDNTSDISALQASVTNLGTHKVAQPLDEYNQPTDGTDGQSLRTKGDGTTEWADVGLPTDAQTEKAINKWLDDHPEATTTVLDGSITEAKLDSALILKTIKDYVTPDMFGAANDGTTDDYQAIQGAIASASSQGLPLVFLEDGSGYYSSQPIVIEQSIDLLMFGALIYEGSGTALTLGKTANQFITTNSILNVKSSSITTGSVGIKIIGLVNSDIVIKDSSYFDTGVFLLGDNSAFAYNTIRLVRIWRSNTGLMLNCSGARGYINENLFIGGRIDSSVNAIEINGDVHDPNNNVFLKPCCEGAAVAIKIIYGKFNTFYDVRTEASTKSFEGSANAHYNRVSIAFGDGPSTVETADNIILTPIRFPDLNNTLFSGSIFDKCAGYSNWLYGENLYQIHNNVYQEKCYSAYRNADNINPVSRPIGFRVKCEGGEKFIIRRSYVESTKGSVLLRFLDSNGDVIAEAPKSISGLSFYSTTLDGTTYYGISDSTVNIMFIIPDSCKELYIGFISGKLAAVNIVSDKRPYIIKHPLICDSEPSSPAAIGTFVACATPNSSNLFGWIYGEDSAWHNVSL